MKIPVRRLAAYCAVAVALPGAAIAAEAIGPDPVTLNGHVAQVMHERCAACHSPNQAAPFSLLTYEDVSKRADTCPCREPDALHAALARRTGLR